MTRPDQIDGDAVPTDVDPRACYERSYTPSWAEETLSRVECWLDGNVLKLQLRCARCGHQIDDFLLIDEGRDPLEVKNVLACNCESEHPGRPDEKRGCGSFAGLDIHLAGLSKDDGSPQVSFDPRPAILRDRAWDEAAERADLERLAQVQTHAEKQSGFFTALLGLLSAALIVQGTEHIIDKPEWARICIAVLFAAGVASGACAILSIARAARGSTRSRADVTGPTFYAHTSAEIKKAMGLLDRAAPPAMLALAFLIVTVALVWVVPPES